MLSFLQSILPADINDDGAAGEDASRASGGSRRRRAPGGGRTDDEIADELLSQFPPYGSRGGGGGGVGVGGGGVQGAAGPMTAALVGPLSPLGVAPSSSPGRGEDGGVASGKATNGGGDGSDGVSTLLTHTSSLDDYDDDDGEDDDDDALWDENDVSWGYPHQWFPPPPSTAALHQAHVGGASAGFHLAGWPAAGDGHRQFPSAPTGNLPGGGGGGAAMNLPSRPNPGGGGTAVRSTSVSSIHSSGHHHHHHQSSKPSIVAAWDQDEIDLWRSGNHHHGAQAQHQAATTATQHGDDSSGRDPSEAADGVVSADEDNHPHSSSWGRHRRSPSRGNHHRRSSSGPAAGQDLRHPTGGAGGDGGDSSHGGGARTSGEDGGGGGGATPDENPAGEVEGEGGPRRHWMPDKLCKHCYSCEVPFTVFRRRHHCRLCGQVFCSNCSAYFVELSPRVTPPPPVSGTMSAAAAAAAAVSSQQRGAGQGGGVLSGTTGRQATMRACKMCYDQVSLWGGGAAAVGMGSSVHSDRGGPAASGGRGDPAASAAALAGANNAAACGTPERRSRYRHQELRSEALTPPPPPGRPSLSDADRERSLRELESAWESGTSLAAAEDLHLVRPRSILPISNSPPGGRGSRKMLGEESAGGGGGAGDDREVPDDDVTYATDDPDGDEEPTTPNSFTRLSRPYGGDAGGDPPGERRRQRGRDDENRNDDDDVDGDANAIVAGGSCVSTDAANRKVGQTAARHLERMCLELLRSDAPELCREVEGAFLSAESPHVLADWVDALLTLATRCCATVRPNVKGGDLLDVRPYSKVKVIPGGLVSDCAYMSGVVFQRNVNHKSMAREIGNPRIMLLSGGIEYTRTENRIASLQTLLEQEEKYMEILVNKIVGLRPDVLLVGRAVSRRAQELLLAANVVLIQHVKPSLMGRISRQTGATILSSTDHVMNQFGTSVLGKCRRFRLVTFLCHETWACKHGEGVDGLNSSDAQETKGGSSSGDHHRRDIDKLLSDKALPNHERQAALAAKVLGQRVVDGAEAVKSGLAKRGVARTYVLMEGCPKQLGCTMVLRGASRSALKQAKRVLTFLVNVAYNLKLETTYMRERFITLPLSYSIPESAQLNSSSLCVDYGQPPLGRKVRPWNGSQAGGETPLRSISGKITAFDHQSILITSVWMTEKTQCCPAEVKGICYYTRQDVSLGQFLHDSCFNLSLKCQNQNCKKSVLEHTLSFIHCDGMINITVEHMDDPLPPAPLDGNSDKQAASKGTENASSKLYSPIATWTYCNMCGKVVTPLVFISEDTFNFSFGKFLEMYFYNRDAIINSPAHGCSCSMQTAATLYFGCGRLATRFTYERVKAYNVFVRRSLPFDESYHRDDALRHLEHISTLSSILFVRFDKHIEKVSREARQLFGSAANKPEHLQTVLSELNTIGSEVDHAAKTLQEKIAATTNSFVASSTPSTSTASQSMQHIDSATEALLRFPWHARRYLYLLTSAWNERLSAAGQALAAMKKLGADASTGPTSDGYGNADDVMEGMKRLRQLQQVYSQYNVGDMSIRSDFEIQPRSPTKTNDLAGSGKESRHRRHVRQVSDSDYHDFDDDINDDDVDYDELDLDYDVEDIFTDATEDADVLASRRRLYNNPNDKRTQADNGVAQNQLDSHSSPRVTKSLGSRRHPDEASPDQQVDKKHRSTRRISKQSAVATGSGYTYENILSRDHLQQLGGLRSTTASPQSKSKTVTAGVAVKSALTRFFNRINKDHDPYIVDLGELAQGRPALGPGIGEMIVPVFDNQPSTVIAHSLSSNEYDDQFKTFLKEGGASYGSGDQHDNGADGGPRSIEDFFGPEASKQHSKAQKRGQTLTEKKEIERRMLVRNKTHIKHTFRDIDAKGQTSCKFVCTTYWATQFQAVRQAFLSVSAPSDTVAGSTGKKTFDLCDIESEMGYVRSLYETHSWAASGGKSGASFARTADGRFVVKFISRTELQMFLDCAPAYFEYLSKAFFHGLPTVLCKILGVYQIGYHNRSTGKRTMEQVAIMPDIFYGRKISKTFDLKGSLRGRFAKSKEGDGNKDVADYLRNAAEGKPSKGRRDRSDLSDSDSSDERSSTSDSTDTTESRSDQREGMAESASKDEASTTLLDGDFLEFTGGRPLPLSDRAKAIFHMSILNDTLFLSIINVLDYSILVGIDEERMELVVGIIDFMRQYDILKQMERVGKSIPMVVGSEAPTIIQPPLYKARFTNAMERYFMTVPTKWTTI